MIPYSLAAAAVRILSRSVSLRMTAGILARVTGQRLLHQGPHPLDLGGLDLQVGELTLDDATQRRLMNEDAGVRQGQALARRTGGQQHRRGRGGLTEAHRLDVGTHVLHGVVDRHQRGERATR